MRDFTLLSLMVLSSLSLAGCHPDRKGLRDHFRDVSLYNLPDLVYARELSEQGIEPFATAVDSLKKMAGNTMMQGSFSVMHKKKIPPSGDKHDY